MQKITENAKNSKKTWEILKEITMGSKCNTNSIDKLMVGNSLTNDPKTIANELNKFFTRRGNKI